MPGPGVTFGAFHPRDRRTILLLASTMFVAAADMLIVTPVLPRMARELSVSIDLAGLWVTAYAAATACFALVFGPISDRAGRRPILFMGTVALGLATVACGLADDYWGLLAARFCAGAAGGLLVTSTTSFVGDHYNDQRRAVAMGWVMSGFFMALILSVPLGALLAHTFGWKLMFRAYGLVILLQAAAMVRWLPHPRHATRNRRLTFGSALRAYGVLLRDRRVLGVLSMSLAMGLSMTMFMVYSSPWLEREFGLDTADRGLVYAVGGPAVILGGPLAGRLSNRFGRVFLVVGGSCLMGLMQLAMPVTARFKSALGPWFERLDVIRFGDHPLPLVAPTLLVFFFAMLAGSSRATPFQTLALEIVPSGRRGTLSALRSTFNHIGSAAGAGLGAAMWVAAERPYQALCWMAAVVTVAGVAVLVLLVGREPQPHLAVFDGSGQRDDVKAGTRVS